MTKSTHAKFRTNQLSYLAGIIDGEGTFNIYKVNPRKFGGKMYVINTHYPLIEWLQTTFGGLVYKRPHAVWKTRYEWLLHSKNVLEMTHLIFPFLIVKKQQAQIMIKFRETFPKIRKSLTPEILSLRQSLYFQLKHLNSRSS